MRQVVVKFAQFINNYRGNCALHMFSIQPLPRTAFNHNNNIQLVIIEFFLSVENIQRDPNSHFDLACWDFTAFTAFSVALLAYNCSAYVLNVQAELNNSSERRMSKVNFFLKRFS